MPRVGFLLKVKPDKIEEYKERHRTIWPEMVAALRAAGWRNYSIFAREDGLIFAYFETPLSLQAAQEQMRASPVYARWQESMAPLLEPLHGGQDDPARPARTLVELEEVFHLD